MVVYIYNNDGYFLYEHTCQKGLDNETLYPGGNYTTQVPFFESGKVPKFNGTDWVNIHDNRGTTIYRKDNLEKSICQTIELDSDYTMIQPPDYYYKWETDNWVVDETKIDDVKSNKQAEIKEAFQNDLENGYFASTALGIDVDCRRTTAKNDLQNVQGLISIMNRNSITDVTYNGYEDQEATGITVTNLTDLTYEMEDHVFNLYNKKWNLEANIEAATTIEDVNNITW